MSSQQFLWCPECGADVTPPETPLVLPWEEPCGRCGAALSIDGEVVLRYTVSAVDADEDESEVRV